MILGTSFAIEKMKGSSFVIEKMKIQNNDDKPSLELFYFNKILSIHEIREFEQLRKIKKYKSVNIFTQKKNINSNLNERIQIISKSTCLRFHMHNRFVHF